MSWLGIPAFSATKARVAAGAVLALLVGLLPSPRAFADADPASDVLLGQDVFYPYSPAVSSALQAALNGETTAARKARFPIKVALIATRVDLGALSTLFGNPKQYAAYLDQEISFGRKVPLLVVMPGGYGTAGLPQTADRVIATLSKPHGSSGNALAQAAITAVPKIATAATHPLAVGAARAGSRSSGGATTVPLAILAAVCVTLAATITAMRHRRRVARRAPRSNERRR